MTSRRALLEDSAKIDEAADFRRRNFGQGLEADGGARRALAEHNRRALTDSVDDLHTLTTGRCTARRALIEPVDTLVQTSPARAFVVPRRENKMRHRLISAVTLVAVVGSISGMTLSKSAALVASEPINPTSQISMVRALPVSRDLVRPAMAADALGGSSTDSDDPSAALADASALAAAAVVEAPEPPAPAEPTPDPVLTIAPGQLPVASVEEALARAAGMVGNMNYGNMCLSLVATFYGYTSAGEVGAQQAAATAAAAGQLRTDMENIPVGALVWYDGTPVGNPYGHVAMYAGDGMVYSNGAANGGVGMIPLMEPATGWGEPVIGWSSVWLPYATK